MNNIDDADAYRLPSSLSSSFDALFSSTLQRATRTLATDATTINNVDDMKETLPYGKNPTIASTALAHALWKYVIRPGKDSAIDATAGNGGDSLMLAQLLFSRADDTQTQQESQLICIDIQQIACQNTTLKLAQHLSPDIIENNVQILHASHAPLPSMRGPVALVVYNLGYLPQSQPKQYSSTVMTSTETTLASLADAALLLRIGGMLSVMTYPKTNRDEHFAVTAFLEGLALFSSNTQVWEDCLVSLENMSQLQDFVKCALQRVRDTGSVQQTWRVHVHAKIGWTDAPVLYTATRIQ